MKDEDIKKTAKLAALDLAEDQIERYRSDLGKVLDFFEQIKQLDDPTEDPLVTPSFGGVGLREDCAQTSDLTEEFLRLAPERVGNLYKVPPVV